tara:strand:+ start:316 stop:894 length:579 start_codon:yes stop_codon:yes gene_type:complete
MSTYAKDVPEFFNFDSDSDDEILEPLTPPLFGKQYLEDNNNVLQLFSVDSNEALIAQLARRNLDFIDERTELRAKIAELENTIEILNKKLNEKQRLKSRDIPKCGRLVTNYVMKVCNFKQIVLDAERAVSMCGERSDNISIDVLNHRDKFVISSYSEFGLDFMEKRLQAVMDEGITVCINEARGQISQSFSR